MNVVTERLKKVQIAFSVTLIHYNFSVILTGKPTGKRPLGRPRCRWEGIIRMDLEKIVINAKIGLIRLRTGIIEEPL